MPTAFLDSFQLIVAFYLFYVSIKGSGQMYRFFDISEEDQMRVRLPLRLIYAIAGIIALVESAVCMLQNQMFTQTITENGVIIIQNFSIEVLPFLTYDMMSTISSALTLDIVLLLAGVVIWLRKLSHRNSKKH